METKSVSRWEYLCTQFNVILIYLRLLIFPVDQALDYHYPFKSGFFDGYTPYAFLVLVITAGIGFLSRKKRPIFTFAIFWFFITLSVESSVIPIRDALYEHRLYLPMVGFALLAGFGAGYLFKKQRGVGLAVVVVVIGLMGVATHLRNRVWQDPVLLWTESVEKNPRNAIAFSNLGVELEKQNRLPEAIRNFKSALQLRPTHLRLMTNLASALIDAGQYAEATVYLRKVIEIDPENERANYHLGRVFREEGQFAQAEIHLKNALAANPESAAANFNLGLVYAGQGREDLAEKHFDAVVRKDPSHADALFNLGTIAFRRGRLEEAEGYFKAVVSQETENDQVYYALGIVAGQLGRLEDAKHYYKEALRVDPNNAETHNNLGVILARSGDYRAAIEHFSAALKLRPVYPRAREGLDEAMKQLSESAPKEIQPR